MAITIDDFSKIWASTSPLTPYSFSDDNYKEGWNFIGGTPPSRQMWDFLQKQNDEKLKYLLDNFNDYLPLAGGTMTGAIEGNPLTLTADDGNGNTSDLVLGADGSLSLDGKRLDTILTYSITRVDATNIQISANSSHDLLVLTATKKGVYLYSHSLYCNFSGSGNVTIICSVNRNGTNVWDTARTRTNAVGWLLNATALLELEVGDEVYMNIVNATNSAFTTNNDNKANHAEITLLREL